MYSSQNIDTINRSALFGDGLFETIKMANARLLWVNDHLQRLQQGAKVLGIEFPIYLTADWLNEQALMVAKNQQIAENARVKLTLFRNGVGKYLPESNEGNVAIQCMSLNAANYLLNEDGISIGIYEAEKKSRGALANLKTTSALLYIMAARYAHEMGFGDALLLNTDNRIVESSSSNLFLVKSTHLHTPSLSEGPVAGIMRKQVLQLAAIEGFGVSSGQVTKEMLLEADELLLTNAINGITWVKSFSSKIYQNKTAKQLVDLLNKNILIA